MIRAIPPHRILIIFVLGIVFGSVAWHVKWANIPKIAAVFSQQFPQRSKPAVQPPGEAVEVRRDRLKDEALAAGRKLLAKPCADDTRAAYKDALIQLARQRMRDMGCAVDFACNVEKNFKEVSLKFYASEKDRRISRQIDDATSVGGLKYGGLGLYLVFVGHPEELANVGGGMLPPSGIGAVCADAFADLPGGSRR